MYGLRPGSMVVLCLVLGGPSAAGPVVNEFVTRPRGEEGEWIEILNPDPVALDLAGWSVRDGTGNARSISGTLLSPGGFAVLASRPESLRTAFALPDSVVVVRPDGWPVLNDRDGSGGSPADLIVLVDPQGRAADSVAYFEAWLPPEAGRSLERAAPAVPGHQAAAWGWSVDPALATPGRRNSLVEAVSDDEDAGDWSGPEFADPSRRPALFRYRMPEPGTVYISLVDARGRVLAVLQPPVSVPSVGQWVWGPGSALPAHDGDVYVCLVWQGVTRGSRRRCLRVWVSR